VYLNRTGFAHMASIQKLPSGKHRAQVRRADVYKARTFARKADAAAWAAQIEQAVERGTGVGKIAPQALTAGEACAAHRHRRHCRRRRTARAASGEDQDIVAPAFAHLHP
jgi:hypothetical protein